MKQPTAYIFSGIIGAMFAVACGAVDGITGKDAVANAINLAIYTESGDCQDSDDNYLPDSMEAFLDEARANDWVVSSAWDNDCSYIEGVESTDWTIAYIK